jgi:hypothetical protein
MSENIEPVNQAQKAKAGEDVSVDPATFESMYKIVPVEVNEVSANLAAENVKDGEEIFGYPRQNVEGVVKLFENGLDSTDEIIGYHGTSLETLQTILKEGVLPGAMLQSDTSYPYDPKDSLFFFPVKEKFQDHYLAHKFQDHNEAAKAVEIYSKLLAGAHYILSELGIGTKNWEEVNLAKSLIIGFPGYTEDEELEALEFFSKNGVTKEQLIKIAEQGTERKGVVLGLKKSILEIYSPTNYNQRAPDLSIVVTGGLSLEHLAGIDPLGQQEWDFLVDLQKAVAKK